MDHAPVRRLRHRRRIQQALPLPPRPGPDRALSRVRPADPDRLRLGRPDGQRRGRQGRRRHRLARGHGDPAQRHTPGAGLDLDDDQRHRCDAASALPAGRGEARVPTREDHRHGAERHPQGVHRPRHVHLSPQALDAPDHRPVRLLRTEPDELEHHLDLRVSHARGRVDRCRGDRAHAQPRDRLRRSGAGGRTRRGRFRAARVLLLRVPYGFLRGGRQVPCRAPDVGAHHARSISRQGRAVPSASLPHPDRRRDADRAATPEQRRAHHARGDERRSRRDAVAAHQRLRRGPRPALAERRRDRPAHAAGDRLRIRGPVRCRPSRGFVLRREPDRPGRGGGALDHG